MLFNLLLSVFGFVLTIFIVVGVHEGAHFLMARLLGIKVLRFSIGFGKALYRWEDKKGTEYVLAPIPLGGYVKLLDETEGEVPESEKHLAFNRQPLYKRAAVVAAGPFSNLVMAVIFYWLMFIIGFQTPVPLIGSIEPHSIASKAGLKPQQEITQVDKHETLSWPAIVTRLIMHVGDQDEASLTVTAFNKKPEGSEQVHLLNLATWQMSDLKPDPLSSLGITPYAPPIPLVLGIIKPGSPAATSPLKVGDTIDAIEDKVITSWDEIMRALDKKPDQVVSFTLSRDHKKSKVEVTLGHRRDLLLHKHGYLGIGPRFEYPAQLIRTIQYGPLDALRPAFHAVTELTYLNLILFGKLITHKLSVLSLGGPITIFESASSALQNGVVSFLSFLAFLNVALGVINFFPIPGLDGGHLLFQLLEAIFRRPISLRVQMLCYRLGFIFLIFILIQALTNDLLRMWGSA